MNPDKFHWSLFFSYVLFSLNSAILGCLFAVPSGSVFKIHVLFSICHYGMNITHQMKTEVTKAKMHFLRSVFLKWNMSWRKSSEVGQSSASGWMNSRTRGITLEPVYYNGNHGTIMHQCNTNTGWHVHKLLLPQDLGFCIIQFLSFMWMPGCECTVPGRKLTLKVPVATIDALGHFETG